VQRRRRFKQTVSLSDRLAEEAARLRERAASMPRGFQRDRLIRKAHQNETAMDIDRWLTSPGLQPPK
jgi:hypothetical protein